MEMGMLSCLVILLISLAHVDARYTVELMLTNEGSICESCLETPKRAEETSRDSKLFERLGKISTEVCTILPYEFKAKCLETSDAYIHRNRLLVNGIFNEETLCNSTGLCMLKSMFSTINDLASVLHSPEEGADEYACTLCRKAVRDIFVQVNKPRMRMRIMESLIEHCEELEGNNKACKQKVYRFAPLALSKLEKIKTNDFCRLMGFCEDESLRTEKIWPMIP